MTRQALGKGLDALLPDTYLLSNEEVSNVPVDRIQPNPYQPRTSINRETRQELEGLKQSILANGIIEPLIARREKGEIQLVSGERRLKAAKAAGLERVPVIFRELEDEKLLEMALVENLQRRSLNPMEEARAYDLLLKSRKFSQAEMAKRVGKTRSAVANSLRLLGLPEEVRDDVAEGRLTMGHAKVLLGLEAREEILALARLVRKEGMSVRDLEDRLREGRSRRKVRARPARRDPHLDAAEAKLRGLLCTRVQIKSTGGKGSIQIEFHTAEELERIYDLLTKIPHAQ